MITWLVDLYYRYKAKKHEKTCNHICCFCKYKYDCDYFTGERWINEWKNGKSSARTTQKI